MVLFQVDDQKGIFSDDFVEYPPMHILFHEHWTLNHWVLVYAMDVDMSYLLMLIMYTPTSYLIDKPNESTEDDAPACAYLKAVHNCTLTFVYTERGIQPKKVVLLW